MFVLFCVRFVCALLSFSCFFFFFVGGEGRGGGVGGGGVVGNLCLYISHCNSINCVRHTELNVFVLASHNLSISI